MAVDVVVFGGSGFIGSSLAAHLSSRGYRVRVADINPPRGLWRMLISGDVMLGMD
jgi:nucleoside-diphosphate-sugar epimerase